MVGPWGCAPTGPAKQCLCSGHKFSAAGVISVPCWTLWGFAAPISPQCPRLEWICIACGQVKGTPPPFFPCNAYDQATPGVGSVNFCTIDFGGAFFNSLYCALCAMCADTLVLRCAMFTCRVKAALLAKRAFVAWFASWFFRIVHHVLDKAHLAVVLHTVHWCRKSRCCR